MKGITLLLIVGFVAVVYGFPSTTSSDEDDQQNEQGELKPLTTHQEEVRLRFRRVTCDLLSVNLPIGSLNHSACAAHCLVKGKGFRGGRCKDGVCHCRK